MKRLLTRLTAQPPFPGHRIQVLLSGSQNRPPPGHTGSPFPPRPLARRQGPEAPKSRSRVNGAILGGGGGDNQSPRGRQGAQGRPGVAVGPGRAPVREAREARAGGLRHVAPSPRPPPRRARPAAAPTARVQLTFSQRLLTWDSESCLHSFSCSTHWSSSLVNTFSSMMPAARNGCRSALLPRRRPPTGHTHTPLPVPGLFVWLQAAARR